MIHRAFDELKVQDPEVDRLRVGLSIAALAAPECEPPVKILRVTPGGVKEIKSSKRKRGHK